MESELKLAHEAIRDLKDRLQKVQQNMPKSSSLQNANTNDLTQFAIIVAVIALILGVIIGSVML